MAEPLCWSLHRKQPLSRRNLAITQTLVLRTKLLTERTAKVTKPVYAHVYIYIERENRKQAHTYTYSFVYTYIHYTNTKYYVILAERFQKVETKPKQSTCRQTQPKHSRRRSHKSRPLLLPVRKVVPFMSSAVLLWRTISYHHAALVSMVGWTSASQLRRVSHCAQ